MFLMVAAYVLVPQYLFTSTCCSDSLDAGTLRQFEKKALAGDMAALANVQLHYMQIWDTENVKKWLVVGANYNDTKSIINLFSFVTHGQQTLDGDAERTWLLEKMSTLANQDPWAASLLGVAYLNGSVLVLKDVAVGKALLRRASQGNEPVAMYTLIELLLENSPTQADRAEAVQLAKALYKSAKQGSLYSEHAKKTLETLTMTPVQ